MFITEESLDKGFWPIIQQSIVNKNILKQYFPNIDLIEQGNIIGINTEGSAIIDDFINNLNIYSKNNNFIHFSNENPYKYLF